MATDTATLGVPAATLGAATDPLGAAPVADPAANPNVFQFKIPNTETNIGVDISNIPAEVRMDFLQKALRDYIVNSVNQANIRANKDNAPFDAYDEAVKADPLQTAVAKPTGERKVADLLGTASAARERLYKGEIRKQGEGTGEKKVPRDPLIKLVTDAVVRELFDNKKATTAGYKYTDAVKEVGGDGVAFLNAKIAEKVAAGSDGAVLQKFMDDRYINPAKMMLGQKDNKNTKDQTLLG